MGERPNQASLKLKATTYTNDPQLFAKVIRSYPNTKDLIRTNYALVGLNCLDLQSGTQTCFVTLGLQGCAFKNPSITMRIWSLTPLVCWNIAS